MSIFIVAVGAGAKTIAAAPFILPEMMAPLPWVTPIMATAAPFWWVAPLATVIAAAAAGIFAFFTIRANRQIARLRASLDLLEKMESGEYYQKLTKAFKDAAKKNFKDLDDDERQDVLFMLNFYELISIGCKTKVLDKNFICRFMRSILIRDWERVEVFVYTLRHPQNLPPRPMIFANFEEFVKEIQKRK